MPDETPIRLNEQRLDELGQFLSRRLEDQTRRRFHIEQRWLEDVRQYHGRYSADIEEILARQYDETGSAKIFVNLTRTKADAAEARIADMLFPSDDRNWLIQPTPDPDLADALDDEATADAAALEMQQAKDASKRMQTLIDDQLNEAAYAATARDVIRDGVRLGTGIVKGPIVVGRTKRAWLPVDGGVHELLTVHDHSPAVKRISPWDFYPDMSARTIGEAEWIFERQYLTKRDVRKLADRPHFLREQIRKVLETETEGGQHNRPNAGQDTLQRLREIAGVYDGNLSNRHELWTYVGPLDREFLSAANIGSQRDRADVFSEMIVEVQFIGDTVIRATRLPLETEDYGYSVWNWVESDGSIFGYGVPYIMRASQEIMNKAWRAMLDNAALSVGPQTVVNQHIIEPADGQWQLTPRKTWWLKDTSRSVNEAFGSFNVDSEQPQLQAIFELAREMADEETALPQIQQGELGNTPIQTATATSMLMNASNTTLRRIVKQWDDGITKPLITRFYDYNMQYSDDPTIKGDMSIDARGASALMVKETQTAALLQLVQIAANTEGLAQITKMAELYRRLVESMRLDPDSIVFTDDEIEQQAQQPEPSIDEQRLALDREKVQAELVDADLDRQVKLIEMANKLDISLEQIEVEMAKAAMQETTKRSEQQLKLITGSGI